MNTTLAIILVVSIVGCFLILAIAWLVHAYVLTRPRPRFREIEEVHPPMRRVFVDRGKVLPKPNSVRSQWFRTRWLKSDSSLNKRPHSIPSSTPESPKGGKHFSIYIREKADEEKGQRPSSYFAGTDVASLASSESTRHGRRLHHTQTFASMKAVAINHARASRTSGVAPPKRQSLPMAFQHDPILERPLPVLSPLQSRYAVLEPVEQSRLTEHLDNIRRAHQHQPTYSLDITETAQQRQSRNEMPGKNRDRAVTYAGQSPSQLYQ